MPLAVLYLIYPDRLSGWVLAIPLVAIAQIEHVGKSVRVMARKELGLEYTDRVRVSLAGSARVKAIVDRYGADLAREVLATSLSADGADVVLPLARGDREAVFGDHLLGAFESVLDTRPAAAVMLAHVA